MKKRFIFSAVYFEMRDYQQCIAMCEKAVEVGRENRTDFKLIAKAFTRIGNSYKALKVSIYSCLECKLLFHEKCFIPYCPPKHKNATCIWIACNPYI